MDAYEKSTGGYKYKQKADNEDCFIDKLWNYCEKKNMVKTVETVKEKEKK